jgi:hypothetical protein
MEREGLDASSIKYNKYREGKAINKSNTIGTTVHTVSNTWESIVNLSIKGLALTNTNT